MTELPEGAEITVKGLDGQDELLQAAEELGIKAIPLPTEPLPDPPAPDPALDGGIWNGSLSSDDLNHVLRSILNKLGESALQKAAAQQPYERDEILRDTVFASAMATGMVIKNYIDDAMSTFASVLEAFEHPTPENSLIKDRALTAFSHRHGRTITF